MLKLDVLTSLRMVRFFFFAFEVSAVHSSKSISQKAKVYLFLCRNSKKKKKRRPFVLGLIRLLWFFCTREKPSKKEERESAFLSRRKIKVSLFTESAHRDYNLFGTVSLNRHFFGKQKKGKQYILREREKRLMRLTVRVLFGAFQSG